MHRIQCVRKKRPKYFFVISSTKLGRFWWNLVHFPNKFAARSCKRFPPHLNNVFTLHYMHNALHYTVVISVKLHVLPLSCWRKKLQNLSHLNCGLQIHQIWIQLITACGKYCKRRCTKRASLIWTNRNSNWERNGPSWITSSLQQPFVIGVWFRSAMRVLYTFSCSIPHTPQSIEFKSGEFGGHC